MTDLTPTAEAAKHGTLNRWDEPNNLDEFEPHGDPDGDEHGSDYWHEISDERLRCMNDPREGLMVCGTCHPELLNGGDDE